MNVLEISIIELFCYLLMAMFTLFYRLLYQANIMISYQHLEIERIIKKLRKNKILILFSCSFIGCFYILRVIQNLIVGQGDPSITYSFKVYNCLQTIFNVTICSVLIFLSIKLFVLSFRYINILSARYQLNVTKVKIILSVIYIPLMCGFAISIFLETMWIYRMMSGTNCSKYFKFLTDFNYYNMCWTTQCLSFIVIWIIWFLAADMMGSDGDDEDDSYN